MFADNEAVFLFYSEPFNSDLIWQRRLAVPMMTMGKDGLGRGLGFFFVGPDLDVQGRRWGIMGWGDGIALRGKGGRGGRLFRKKGWHQEGGRGLSCEKLVAQVGAVLGKRKIVQLRGEWRLRLVWRVGFVKRAWRGGHTA